MIRKILVSAGSLLLLALLASPSWADTLNRQIRLTVNTPVELSGHVLEPGHYSLTPIDREGNFVVGSSRVDLQACKLEYSIVSPK